MLASRLFNIASCYQASHLKQVVQYCGLQGGSGSSEGQPRLYRYWCGQTQKGKREAKEATETEDLPGTSPHCRRCEVAHVGSHTEFATVPPVRHQWSVSNHGTGLKYYVLGIPNREHRGRSRELSDFPRDLSPFNFWYYICSSPKMIPTAAQTTQRRPKK